MDTRLFINIELIHGCKGDILRPRRMQKWIRNNQRYEEIGL